MDSARLCTLSHLSTTVHGHDDFFPSASGVISLLFLVWQWQITIPLPGSYSAWLQSLTGWQLSSTDRAKAQLCSVQFGCKQDISEQIWATNSEFMGRVSFWYFQNLLQTNPQVSSTWWCSCIHLNNIRLKDGQKSSAGSQALPQLCQIELGQNKTSSSTCDILTVGNCCFRLLG